ncbi:carbohydrate ABC transporter permease [Kineococcus aurantiacus]|uniref:Multiple sugar transport system permease protein n=1 Tax=Kineococcus aurantiacus TaxID=37633 RepID=A0A7Y9DHE2_9ACTN|nr:sugar ABC transporter permease [Kineococcus aurantiacus]NYD21296.1 multiple sugar transport system permease protein [Kineococcus aurantiacus]
MTQLLDGRGTLPRQRGRVPGRAVPGRHRPGHVSTWLAAPSLAGLALMLVYPTVFVVALAVTKSSLARPLQRFTGTDNLVEAWESLAFAGSLVRSVVFAVLAALAATALGVVLALLLHARGTRFGVVGTILLLPLVTPPVMVGVAWKLMLAPVGGAFGGLFSALGFPGANPLGDSVGAFGALVVMHVWQWTPLVTLLVFAALLGVPEELREAAALDGAGAFRSFTHVVWPVIAPNVFSVLLLELVIGLKVFDLVTVVTQGGPGVSTIVSSFEIFRTGMRGSYEIGTAAAETLVFGLVVGVLTTVVTLLRARAVRADR